MQQITGKPNQCVVVDSTSLMFNVASVFASGTAPLCYVDFLDRHVHFHRRLVEPTPLSYHLRHVSRTLSAHTGRESVDCRFVPLRLVWDGDKSQKNVCVNIQGNKIQSVGACPRAPSTFLRYTAIPGMIDVHTHLTYVQENPVTQGGRGAAVVYLAAANAKKNHETGVTTVRDLGAQNYSDIAMRDLINKD